jgi:hypothetical protein
MLLKLICVVIAGFPARSPDFAALQGQALGEMQERDRAHYLAYLAAQAQSQRMKKQLEGDGDGGDDRKGQRRKRSQTGRIVSTIRPKAFRSIWNRQSSLPLSPMDRMRHAGCIDQNKHRRLLPRSTSTRQGKPPGSVVMTLRLVRQCQEPTQKRLPQ